jgi:MFS transporter, putative metabolite:H+ symporter
MTAFSDPPREHTALATVTPTLEQISARLDRLPVSHFHFKVLSIAAASLLFDTLDGLVTAFVLADLRSVWNIDVATIGFISAIGLSGYLVGALACGFVADRIGRKPTILFTLVLYSLCSALRGLSNGVPVFAGLNFLTFVFIGAESSTVPPYLAELWPARVRGKLNGWVMGFFGLGIALSPIWALVIIPNFGWRWALYLTAPFALFGGIMRAALPESPRWLVRIGRGEQAEATLKRIEAQVERETARALPAALVRADTRACGAGDTIRPRELLTRRYRRITLMLWAAWFAEYGVFYAFQTFVPTILAAEGYAIVKSFAYSSVIYGAAVPAYVLGGQLVEWIDRKYSVLAAFAATALFGTLFGLATQPWQFMLFGGLMAFSLAIGSSAIYTYTPELYPTEVRVTGMGIASAWGRAGAVSALLVFGVLFKTQGKSLLFIISDSILLIGGLAIACFGRSTRGRRLEDVSTGAPELLHHVNPAA